MGKKLSPTQKYAKKVLLIKEVGSKVIKAKIVTEKEYATLLLDRSWINMTRVKILMSFSPQKRKNLRNLLDASLDPE